MELRPGYKTTEVGVIPDAWCVKPLGDVADFLDGKRRPVKDSDRAKMRGDIPYYGASGIVDYVNDYLFDEDLILLGEDGENILSRNCRLAFKISGKAWVNNHAHVIRPKSGMELDYLVEFLESRNYEQYNTGTAQPKLNRQACSGIPVVCPTPIEQRAIATALGDIDALLAGLDRLIAKKRDLKQAAMQQLLAGQTRLPGFHERWTSTRLGDLLSFKNGLNKAKAFFGHGTPIVNYMDVFRHSKLLASRVAGRVSLTSGEIKTFDVRKGDVFFTRTSETTSEIGMAAVMLDEPTDTVFSGFLLRARPIDNRLRDEFKAYCFQSTAVRQQIVAKASYTTRALTNGRLLSTVVLNLPSGPEQSAIAAVLSDMDAELTALEARRDKTRALKQGMMQELLTGRTRLIDASPAAPVQEQVHTESRKANIHFLRAVLAAEIVDQLHQEPTFGHVKLEKMVFLAEHLCQVDTGSTYLRKAAGPLDRKALHSIDSQLRTQSWFDARKQEGRYIYVPLAKHGGHKAYFDRYYTPIAAKLSEIIETFRALSTERCEIVATLYAAWNDLLRDKGSASDDAIVHEVLNHWHEAKQRISEDRWRKALDWMREKGFVPQGTALP